MAKPSEILTTEARQRNISPGDKLYDVLDTTHGLTEARREANIGKILGNTLLLKDADYNPDAAVPSLADVLSFYGLKDTEDKKAVDKFLESFSKKLPQWRKQALDDPKWGKSGWETIKKIFQQAVKDKMYTNIAEDRRKIMRGEDEEGLDWLRTKVANVMFPRATAAGEEGRDPETNEWVRDIASNAAYAVPVSRIIGSAAKTAPVIVRGISQGAGQFAAPVAVATMDNIVDDSRDAGDWATDVTIGGMTNLGVNKVVGPWLAGKLGALSGNIAKRGKLGKFRDILEGSPSPEQKAADLVSGAEGILKGENRGLSAGLRSAEAPPTREAVSEAQKIVDIAKVLKEPVRMPDGRQVFNGNTGKPMTTRELLSIVEQQKGDEMLAREAEDVLGSITQQVLSPRTATAPINEAFSKGAKDYAAVFAAHPELKSMFLESAPFLSKKVTSNLPAMLQTYAINQVGSSSDKAADLIGTALGMGNAKEIREKNTERKAKAAHKARVSDILTAPGADAEDVKWLTIVKDNPKVLQYGYADDPEGFKRWMLTRGNDLLRGTPLYRPAWEVE